MYVYVYVCVWCIVSLGGMNSGVHLKLKFALDSVDCVYVCIYVYMCVCMVYVGALKSTNLHTYTHAYMHKNTHTHIFR
jgi:hypothetical protein